ncbi:MAG TPA: DKNYY domain-containing protein, partial [Planctomycetaceae bacterium]|nr:DKNYY domain-containing protein [Planctomycetaceae bacterium]
RRVQCGPARAGVEQTPSGRSTAAATCRREAVQFNGILSELLRRPSETIPREAPEQFGENPLRYPMKSCYPILLAVVTFTSGCSTGYTTESGKVYWQGWNEAVGKYKTLVKDADAKTFRVMPHANYGKDSNNCFYQTERINGADPDTFTTITQYHAKDDKHAYLQSQLISGSDGPSFELLDSKWGRDANRCYCGTEPIAGSDPDTFTVIGGYLNSWAKDANSYYHEHKRVPTTDVASFEILDGGFAKDRKDVFFHDQIVAGADAGSFQMVKGTYIGKDKNGFYRFGQPFQPTPDWVRKHGG